MRTTASSPRWTRAAAAGTLGAFLIGIAGAADFLRPAQPDSLPAMSNSERVVFRGFDSADTAMLGRWAESIIRGVEGLLGVPVPFESLEIIRMSANRGEPADGGRVLVSQGVVNGLLHQKVVLINPERVTEKELREALVGLLITRCALSHVPHRAAAESSAAPGWLVAGIATNLEPAAPQGHAPRRELPQRIVLSLSSILSPNRTDDPAFVESWRDASGRFVSWLDANLGSKGGWTVILERLGSETEVSLDWMAETVFDQRSRRTLEKQWDVWLARQAVLQPRPNMDFDMLAGLKRRLAIFPADYGVDLGEGLAYRVQPADLIPYRDEDWVRTAVSRVRWELERFAVGKPAALVDVVTTYQEFLDSLLHAPEQNDDRLSDDALLEAATIATEAVASAEQVIAPSTEVEKSDGYAQTAPSSPARPADPSSATNAVMGQGAVSEDEKERTADLESQRRRFLEAILQGREDP